jgi:hypothetical protein
MTLGDLEEWRRSSSSLVVSVRTHSLIPEFALANRQGEHKHQGIP